MKTLTRSFFFLFFTLIMILPAGSAEPAKRPWWDSFPRIIQDPLKDVVSHHGNIWMGGGGSDPFMGIYLQRRSTIYSEKQFIQPSREKNIARIVWYEGFGTAHTYISQFKKGPDGKWIRGTKDPGWIRIFAAHSNWQNFDGTGLVRWVGIPNHFEDDPLLRPWTCSHPKYGCGPMRYPDGTIATGFIGKDSKDWDYLFGPDVDPRTSRIFDAGCSKDVFGQVFFEYGYNADVNKIDPKTRKPKGPLTGLAAVKDAPIGTPDPGFTYEEWKKAKSAGYAGDIMSGKDIACPIWIDYLDGSIRHALDEAQIDGLWVDNFSAWDNFNSRPIQRAFGEWTVAGFRDFLVKEWMNKLPPEYQSKIDPKTFDVRKYLVKQYHDWGGTGNSLKEVGKNFAWRDPRWKEDPIWRAFLIYKRRAGFNGLTRYYETVKKRAAEAGKPDFLVTGNDIPGFSLGWVRDNLDMVSTEMGWNHGSTFGAKGLLPPPDSAYVAVYRLAREHAKSRFVNVWMYVPKKYFNKENIGNVLHYQGLANHTMPKAQLTFRHYGLTAGTPEGVAEYFGFVEKIEPVFRDRTPLPGKTAILYSSSSQLCDMAPLGFYNMMDLAHSFSFYGWGTALVKRQIPWTAVPEWKLTLEKLRQFDLLIVPSVDVLGNKELALLEDWTGKGGRLIISGPFAVRGGEEENFDLRSNRESPLIKAWNQSVASKKAVPLGKGFVVAQKADPGYKYYNEKDRRPETQNDIGALLNRIKSTGITQFDDVIIPKNFPFGVDITLHQDGTRFFIDMNNTQIDLDTDTITSSGRFQFQVLLPKDLIGKDLKHTVYAPKNKPEITITPAKNGYISVEVSDLDLYSSLVLEKN
ncbi:MAG: hypothetical protein Q4G69_14010 [Planctomycetia bacterium]|nr:hypothetical protein [Planctomycetia bacterium]